MASILTIYINNWCNNVYKNDIYYSKKSTMPAKLQLKNVIGLAYISLGAMICALGALAMAAQESDSKPREAVMISLIPTLVTVVVSSSYFLYSILWIKQWNNRISSRCCN